MHKNIIKIILCILVMTSIMVLTGNTVSGTNTNYFDEIHQSIVLDQNITISGSGYIVTANDLTIDCQFNSIRGDGTGTGVSFLNNNNITVKNCIIERFGVALNISNSFVFLNTSLITNNDNGIVIQGFSTLETDQNSIKNNSINLNNTNQGINITAINNWWGSNVSSEIESKIVGNVIFEPFSTIDPYSDEDNDGIFLFLDNCPSDYNPDQIDLDSDKKGDACDVNIFINSFTYDPTKENITIEPALITTKETGYFIIQFFDIELRDNTSADIDGNILGFIPQDAYVIKSTKSKREIQNHSNVRWAEIFQPAFKFSPNLYDKVIHNNLSKNVSAFKVEFFQGTKDTINQSLRDIGAVIIYEFENTFTFNLTEKDIINVSFLPDVFLISPFIEPIYKNDKAKKITGVQNIQTSSFSVSFTGTGEWIDILDGGLDNGIGCKGIADCNTKNPGIYNDFRGRIIELRKTTGAGDTIDGDGHGTHVAGIAVGDGTRSGGQYSGVAMDAQFMMQQRAGNEPAGLNYGINQGYKIHSNSWGGIECNFGYLAEAKTMDSISYNNFYSILVFAAGNEEGTCGGTGQKSIQPESVAKNVITVGATENNRPTKGADGDDPEDIASFSSRGPSLNPTTANAVRIKPDIVAPGTWIISTRSSVGTSTGWGLLPIGDPNRLSYLYMGGTSMATPHVSGALALTLEYLRVLKNYNTASGSLLKAMIINGAKDIGGLGTTAGGTLTNAPNNDQGWGRLDMVNTLFPNGRHTSLLFKDDEDPNKLKRTGDPVFYPKIAGTPLRFSNSTNVSITLVWTDKPAATLSHVLTNDLDLILTDPNGNRYRGNIFNAQGDSVKESVRPGQRDGVNNVEKIKLVNPEDGFYKITILAKTISGDPQKFALVVSPVLGIDSANTTDVTYYFPYGSKIYAQAVGLPNNAGIEVVTVAHRDDFTWKETKDITDTAAKGVNGFTFLNTKQVTTTVDGTFPDSTEIWDTQGKKDEIFENNGKFNMFVNFGAGHPIKFNEGVDVVDYHEKVGFNVSIADSSNSEGDFKDKFPFGTKVHIKGVGFEPGKDVDIYAVKDRSWSDGDVIQDPKAHQPFKIKPDGSIERLIWDSPQINDIGKYDLIVDVNRNGNYDKEFDVVDGLNDAGFEICKEGEDRCGYRFIEGKGVWIYDISSFMTNPTNNINNLKEKGISHIIFLLNRRNADSEDYSRQKLIELLPLAHQNGIKVFGWLYPYIHNSEELQRYADETIYAATEIYCETNNQICGEKLDGIIADIEYEDKTIPHRPTPDNVKQYADKVRDGIPKNFIFAVAPDYRLNDGMVHNPPDSNVVDLYPVFGDKFDAIIPQVYWALWQDIREPHTKEFVSAAKGLVRTTSKNANIPVAILAIAKTNSGTLLEENEINAGLLGARDSHAIGMEFWKYDDINNAGFDDQFETIKKFNWPTSIDIYNYESNINPFPVNLHRTSAPFKEGGYLNDITWNKEKYVDGQYHINGIPIKSFVNDYIRLENYQYVEYSFNDSVNGNGYKGEYVYLLLNAVNGLRIAKNHKIGIITIDYTEGNPKEIELRLGKNIRNNYDGNLVWNYYGQDPMYVTELEDTENAGLAWKNIQGDWWVGMLRIQVGDIPIKKIRVASVNHGVVFGEGVKPAIQLMGISVTKGDYPIQVLPTSVKKKNSNQIEPNFFEGLFYMVLGSVALPSSPSASIDFYQAGLTMMRASIMKLINLDPLDENYMEIVEPPTYEVPQLNYSEDMPHNLTDQLNTELRTEVNTLEYLEALYISINRYTTALEVRDNNSAQMQLTAIKRYSENAANSMTQSAQELQGIIQTRQQLGLTNPKINLIDVIGLQKNISESGFSPEMMEVFEKFNKTPDDIQKLKHEIAYLNPEVTKLDLISLLSQKESNYRELSKEFIEYSSNITTHPYIISVFPENLKSNVSIDINLISIFSENMNHDTISNDTFFVMDGNGNPVNGTINYISENIFELHSELRYNSTYTAILTTEIESHNGTNMGSNFTWRFTTGTAPDRSPPLTYISLNPPVADGKNDWYVSNIQVNINAIDIQSGVNKTEYSFDNITWLNYSSAFSVDKEGNTTIYARSYDNASNIETPVKTEFKLDKTYPVTTATLNGTILNETFTKNATLTLTATDNLSGIASINYSIDGIIWNNYLEPITVTRMGLSRIFYRSEDNASNMEEAKSIDVVISNPPPILNIIPDITVNETKLIRITPTASDPENDSLTFNFSPPLNSSGMWQTTYEDAGEYTARVTVSDGFSKVSQDVKITVLNVNRPPILAPIGSLGAMEGSYFSYSVSASDPDNDQLTYSDDSSMFEINPFTGEIGFVPQDAGNHSFNITVSDGAATVSANVSLEVRNTNNPPEMEFIFPANALVGKNFTLQVNASDPDGDQLTYSDDTGLFDINETTGLIGFTPGSDQVGNYFINISVSDGVEIDYAVLNLVVRPEKSLKLEPIQDIIAYVGDFVKIIANATYG